MSEVACTDVRGPLHSLVRRPRGRSAGSAGNGAGGLRNDVVVGVSAYDQ